MTRINCIPASELSDKHLLAEWHEAPRIITMVENQINDHGTIKIVPTSYIMGRGHMQFFADKCAYITVRMFELWAELKKRGVNADRKYALDVAERVGELPAICCNNWKPNACDRTVNLIRLIERDPDFYLKDVSDVA